MFYDVKLVPDDQPNAEGEWACRWYDSELTFDSIPLAPGHHIVAIRRSDPQPAPPDQPFYMHSNC